MWLDRAQKFVERQEKQDFSITIRDSRAKICPNSLNA